jgi:hypothetical protein
MLPKIVPIYVFSAIVSLSAQAQDAIVLDGFLGVPQTGQVQLRWTISAGQTCNGTSIERSTDTIRWEKIGEIPGVCGSSAAAVPYNFIDNSPVSNTVNFYRLELGGQGYSTIVGIPYYDYSGNGYVLIPNPLHDSGTLYFGTSENEAFTLSIFDISGKLVQQAKGTGGNFSINASDKPAGNYVFVITRQGIKNVSGKFIIR